MSHFTNDPDPLGHTRDERADEGACPNCDGTGIDPDSLGTCPACHDRPTGEWVQVGVASHANPGYTEAKFNAADVPAGTVLYARGVPVVDEAQERIAFEAWCESRGRGHSTVLKFDNGGYRNETAREEWRGWLGRATHSSGVKEAPDVR